MAKYVVKQRVQGLRTRTISFEGTQDDLNALLSLMAGKVEVYEVKNTVGTEAPYPSVRNSIAFQTLDDTGLRRATVKIPHLKPSKNSNDLQSFVIGNFDANYKDTIKCSSMKLLYNRNETQ